MLGRGKKQEEARLCREGKVRATALKPTMPIDRDSDRDRDALASILLYCRMEAERQGLPFSAYLIEMSFASLVNHDRPDGEGPAIVPS